jgi:hypothetical protein
VRALFVLWALLAPGGSDPAATEQAIREALRRGTGVIELAAGEIRVSGEIVVPEGAHDLEIRGAAGGTVLRAADDFRGRAMLVSRGGRALRFVNFTVDGNRGKLAKRQPLPPGDVPFHRFYSDNGILVEGARGIAIARVSFRELAAFPVLVAGSEGVRIDGVSIENSGSLDAAGRNNTTGGILLEEGCADFEVTRSKLRNVRGNGIWTHSLYTSPRNRDGRIRGNEIAEVARDAIQVGHATRVEVAENRGRRIGYPVEEVSADPVAIDTAGNTDRSRYRGNEFEEVNGKCIDLDGFHHGEVRGNTCVNRGPRAAYPNGHFGIVFNNTNPDMRSEEITVMENVIDGAVFGGIFVIGSRHRIVDNRLERLNLAGCAPAQAGCVYWKDEPALLSSGIYLGRRAERPARTEANVIRGNTVTGFGMERHCIAAAPGVSLDANRIGPNRCLAGGGR